LSFRKSFPGKLLVENWGLKVLSLAFATLLWMFVVGEKRSEVSLSIPVALSLQGVQPGTVTFENLAARIKLPKRIDVTYISPSSLSLELDAKAKRSLKVRPRIKGDPAEGFELVEVRADPPVVAFEGAEKVLERLGEVNTQVLDVSGLEGNVSRPVELSLPDPSLRRVSQGTVRVEVVVRERTIQREFLQLPVETPGEGWSVSPGAVDVKIEGGARKVRSLTEADLSARVEISGRAASGKQIPVVVDAPPEVKLLSVTPKKVEVRSTGAKSN
jgi:YbbR domain-containing protein